MPGAAARRRGWWGLAALVTGCGAGEAPPPAAPPEGPSVLLVTLDTTRADRMSAYGGDAAARTPAFDAVAAAGALFTRATSSAPLTIPSHSTLMTGRFPPSHGVRDNGNHVLPEEAVTLAERFRDAGWATGGFTAAFPTSHRWGFQQGFDVFTEALYQDPAAQDWRDERPGDEVVDDALAWLAATPGPAFVWVHLFDAHWPYAPPEPFRSAYPDDPYRGEIAFADSQVARVVEAMAARGPAIVAITADHGEGLGEGGEATHGFLLHDATLRVPLALSGPGVPAGQVVDLPVSHVDVAPTLLRLAGLPLHEGLQGQSLLDGGTDTILSEAMTGRNGMGLADMTAITTPAGRLTRGAWTAFYPFDAARGVVSATPDPTADLTPHVAALAALEARLDVVPAAPPADGDVGELLAAMGYVAGDPDAAPGQLDPRDVMDVVPRTWEIRRLLQLGRVERARRELQGVARRLPGAAIVEELTIALLRREGAFEEAASRSLTAASLRDTAEAWRSAGEAALDAGWVDEAVDAFSTALARVPSDARSMVGLVRALVLRDGPGSASDLTASFLRTYPDLSVLQLVQGEDALAALRPDAALTHAQAALAEDPLDPWALDLEARAAWELGRPELAIDALQDLRRLAPRDLDVRLRLTDWLLDVGRHAEAVRAIRPALAELPHEPEVVAAHARAQAALEAERRR